MSSPTTARRTALALLAPLLAAGLVATAGSAAAIPFEGEPTPTTCLRVVPLAGAGPAGSTLFVSHGLALVLVDGADCWGTRT
jgi:hypothetical protein